MKSQLFSLKARDFLKSFVIAIGTPILYVLQELIPNWPLNPIEKAGLSAGVTYLLKNLFTDDIKVSQKILSEAAKDAAKDANS
jgi:hypothetical protein